MDLSALLPKYSLFIFFLSESRIITKSTPNARLAFVGLHRLSRIIQFQNQVVRRASGACPQKSDLIA